jgi:hypothetical protein
MFLFPREHSARPKTRRRVFTHEGAIRLHRQRSTRECGAFSTQALRKSIFKDIPIDRIQRYFLRAVDGHVIAVTANASHSATGRDGHDDIFVATPNVCETQGSRPGSCKAVGGIRGS